MTNDELEKYKEQIARLKREFHQEQSEKNAQEKKEKQTPPSIENSKESQRFTAQEKKEIESVKQEILASKKQKEEKQKSLAPNEPKKQNPFIDSIRAGDKKGKEKATKSPVEQVKPVEKVIKKPVQYEVSKEKAPIINKAQASPKPVENKPKKAVASATTEKKVNSAKVKTSAESFKKNSIQIPEEVHYQHVNYDKDGFDFLKLFKRLLIILVIILLCWVFYYFINRNLMEIQRAKNAALIEQNISDSTSKYMEDLIITDYNSHLEDHAVEEENQEVQVAISDTIFNIVSEVEPGYYAIIGSFSKQKYAQRLGIKHKTSYEAVVFPQKPIRVGLKVQESSAFESLEVIRSKYDDAWLIYNRNE